MYENILNFETKIGKKRIKYGVNIRRVRTFVSEFPCNNKLIVNVVFEYIRRVCVRNEWCKRNFPNENDVFKINV